jgi:hypothetical protein
MTQPSDAAWVRLSSKHSSHFRWIPPVGFLILAGVWIVFGDLGPGNWEYAAVFLSLLFFVTLWIWNRASQDVDVWIRGDKTQICGRAGTVDLALNEIKRVRIIEELGWGPHPEDHIDRPFHFTWERRSVHSGDRVEVEFEDMTVLGKRVVFRLDRISSSERPDRDPRFERWMKAVNRQNSNLNEVEVGKGGREAIQAAPFEEPEASDDPIKRMRTLGKKRELD